MSMPDVFAHRTPNDAQIARIQQLRTAYYTLLEVLAEVSPQNTRERELAIHDLETSAMWAIKGVVFEETP